MDGIDFRDEGAAAAEAKADSFEEYETCEGSSTANASDADAANGQGALFSSPMAAVSAKPRRSRRGSSFGRLVEESKQGRPSFLRQTTQFNAAAGRNMTRRKKVRLELIPDQIKNDLAVKELAEIKRRKTVGVKYNSATVFTLMWGMYVVLALGYSMSNEYFNPCFYWAVYIGLRAFVLVPSSVLAWCWKENHWPRSLPTPETCGVALASYIAVIICLGFTTSINATCGSRLDMIDQTIKVRLSDKDATAAGGAIFQLRRGDCDVYSAGYAAVVGNCSVGDFVDRRTYFEQQCFQWVGQLILVLFAFTSLFKPSKRAVALYTGIVWLGGFLGCVWQGTEFWGDAKRVQESGIATAIALFFAAAFVNIYSAAVMHDLERQLVSASFELSDSRYAVPSGDRVVYLKAEAAGLPALAKALSPESLAATLGLAKGLKDCLAKEYFGTELTLDDELKGLMDGSKPMDPATVARVQQLMKSGGAGSGALLPGESLSFLLAFHDCFDAVSFALAFQDELMDLDWPKDLKQQPEAEKAGVVVTPAEKDSRARAMAVGTFGRAKETDNLNLTAFRGLRVRMGVHLGPDAHGLSGATVKFAETLAVLAEGGMVLLSPPVADILGGALEQLSSRNAGTSKAQGAKAAAAALAAPRLVHLGVQEFSGAAHFHASQLETFEAEVRAHHAEAQANLTALASILGRFEEAEDSGGEAAGRSGPGFVLGGGGGGGGDPAGGALGRESVAGLGISRTRSTTIQDDDHHLDASHKTAYGQLKPVLLPDGRILTPPPMPTRGGEGDLLLGAVELYHVYHAPLFGRHIHWDDVNLRLSGTQPVTLGYYDAPVQRESRPDLAVVLFGDVMFAHHLQAEAPKAFSAACGEVTKTMGRLLVKHQGYNVPQREGHFMQVFSKPRRAVAYHMDLQRELLKVTRSRGGGGGRPTPPLRGRG